jgi:ribonuclease HI
VSGRRGDRGPGGWCAIVEDGSSGYVLRGRVPATTSTRMELVGMLRGLESLDDGRAVVLHVDCTTILSVIDYHERNEPKPVKPHPPKDVDLWEQLWVQFDRLTVRIELVSRGVVDPIHRRCHQIARTEAKSYMPERVRARELTRTRLKMGMKRQHLPGCDAGVGLCLAHCPVNLYGG